MLKKILIITPEEPQLLKKNLRMARNSGSPSEAIHNKAQDEKESLGVISFPLFTYS
jgi:hypothetical protein